MSQWEGPATPLVQAYRDGMPKRGRDSWLVIYCETERIVEVDELADLLVRARKLRVSRNTTPKRPLKPRQVPDHHVRNLYRWLNEIGHPLPRNDKEKLLAYQAWRMLKDREASQKAIAAGVETATTEDLTKFREWRRGNL